MKATYLYFISLFFFSSPIIAQQDTIQLGYNAGLGKSVGIKQMFVKHYAYELNRLCIKQAFFVKFYFDSQKQIKGVAFSAHTDTTLKRIVNDFLLRSSADWIVPQRFFYVPILMHFKFAIASCPTGDYVQAEAKGIEQLIDFEFEPFINYETQTQEWLTGLYFYKAETVSINYDLDYFGDKWRVISNPEKKQKILDEIKAEEETKKAAEQPNKKKEK